LDRVPYCPLVTEKVVAADRLAAALPLLNPFTGVTPGRLFQMASKRSVGQAAASSANSCWLVKDWDGLVTASLLWGAKGADVVVGVDGERFHFQSPCSALRGHHMDHSEVLEKQGDLAINRGRRRSSDGEEAVAQIAPGCAK
jgi:hypothetical protein